MLFSHYINLVAWNKTCVFLHVTVLRFPVTKSAVTWENVTGEMYSLFYCNTNINRSLGVPHRSVWETVHKNNDVWSLCNSKIISQRPKNRRYTKDRFEKVRIYLLLFKHQFLSEMVTFRLLSQPLLPICDYSSKWMRGANNISKGSYITLPNCYTKEFLNIMLASNFDVCIFHIKYHWRHRVL